MDMENTRNKGFKDVPEQIKSHELELAIEIADRIIGIQEVEDGYDYSIYGKDYKLIDGGVYETDDLSIREALDDIIKDLQRPQYDAVKDLYYRTPAQGEITIASIQKEIDYEELMDKADAKAQEEILEAQKPDFVELFRAKTLENYHSLHDQTVEDIESSAWSYVQAVLNDVAMGAKVVDAVLIGSRARAIYQYMRENGCTYDQAWILAKTGKKMW